MPQRKNCWEYFECGHEPGGAAVGPEGPCPASTETELDGVNRGCNAGRACWMVTGVLFGETMCTVHARVTQCVDCEFYASVIKEETEDPDGSGFAFAPSPEVFDRLRRRRTPPKG